MSYFSHLRILYDISSYIFIKVLPVEGPSMKLRVYKKSKAIKN